MKAQRLAQELTSRYLSELDGYATNEENVRVHLRQPIQSVTLFILKYEDSTAASCNAEKEGAAAATAMTGPTEEQKANGADWRDYLAQGDSQSEELPDLKSVNVKDYEALDRRSKARVDAFLNGAAVAVPNQDDTPGDASSPTNSTSSGQQGSVSGSQGEISLKAGLSGFATNSSGNSSTLSTFLPKVVPRKVKVKHPQIDKDELTTRVELYIRSLYRVKEKEQCCVVLAEPARALKARARSIVVAFVDSVDTVQSQNAVLTRLLKFMTCELLAVEVLSEGLQAAIRRLVSDYIQSVSFASLAFLTSPENSADQKLTPVLMKYFRYLQANWEHCEAECELERMLTFAIDEHLRRTLKTIEFTSIGHLLEVCRDFRHELQHIDISPDMRVVQETAEDNDAVRQALRDLKREVITINGNVLPPFKSRKQLISVLSQTLNSRALTPLPPRVQSKRGVRRTASTEDESESESTDGFTTTTDDERRNETPAEKHRRRRRSFRLSTVDFLTKRLLLAASRTGTGGDAYFVVRDLFGGDEVEVVPSKNIFSHGRQVRPGSIEIAVKLTNVIIKCHGSFDVYPKALVGDVEPLIQLHTTTSETISLQEVRASDSASDSDVVKDQHDSDGDDNGQVMVVQERKTERTGWRTLSVRPALYEQVESFSTPS